MFLTEDQKKIGRRNFLKAVAALPAAAAFPFVYNKSQVEGGPVKVGFIGTGNEGRVLMHNADPDFVKVVAVCDIYPPNLELAKRYAEAKFGPGVQTFEDYKKLIEMPEVEAIITACPLAMHHPITMAALEAGKHVLCEKLMAKTIGECKEMTVKANEKGLVLQIGHQRHYSNLYHQAIEIVRSGALGRIHHIRALWHRNGPGRYLVPNNANMVRDIFYVKDKDGKLVKGGAWEINGSNTSYRAPAAEADRCKKVLEITDEEAAKLWKDVEAINAANGWTKYGYDNYEHMRNWRMYRKYGAGLMAELGSHQFDACGLILDAAYGRTDDHFHPLSVMGHGYFTYKDGRENFDHVFSIFEYPEEVTVTYSSICTNKFDNYGEAVFGTKGTLIIEGEKDVMYWAEATGVPPVSAGAPKSLEVDLVPGKAAGDKAHAVASPSVGMDVAVSGKSGGGKSWQERGYKEEIQHFAICVRSKGRQKPRCDGLRALGDAAIALKANQALDNAAKGENSRVKFDKSDFEI